MGFDPLDLTRCLLSRPLPVLSIDTFAALHLLVERVLNAEYPQLLAEYNAVSDALGVHPLGNVRVLDTHMIDT